MAKFVFREKLSKKSARAWKDDFSMSVFCWSCAYSTINLFAFSATMGGFIRRTGYRTILVDHVLSEVVAEESASSQYPPENL